MPESSDFTRAGTRVSRALVATNKRPEGMNDTEVRMRILDISHAIYHAKQEFLAKVDELAQEAMGLALVEKSKRGTPDAEMLQCDAYKLIRQGVESANANLDAVKTGIEIAGRAFGMSRKAQA